MNRSLLPGLRGFEVYDRMGAKIGRVHQYNEAESPDWLSLALGFFGQKKTFVPASMVQYSYGRVIVPFNKETVLSAPAFPNDVMTELREKQLAVHYGLFKDSGQDAGMNEVVAWPREEP